MLYVWRPRPLGRTCARPVTLATLQTTGEDGGMLVLTWANLPFGRGITTRGSPAGEPPRSHGLSGAGYYHYTLFYKFAQAVAVLEEVTRLPCREAPRSPLQSAEYDGIRAAECEPDPLGARGGVLRGGGWAIQGTSSSNAARIAGPGLVRARGLDP